MQLPVTDPILVFTILIGVILVAPLIAERLRMPDLVLVLIAGAALGPHGLGVLERGPALKLLGSVGLLYIMFLAGLEIDLDRFAKARRRTISFGLITFSVPQLAGTLLGRYVLGMDWRTSVLLASMFASHTLLAYPIASRLGISRSEPVAVTVGATIITDTLALLVLAVIADSAKGVSMGWTFWTGLGLGMAALTTFAWQGIPRLSRWFFQHVSEKGGAQFLYVLAVTCGCSYLSHYAKLEPIIGAFLAGAAFNRLIARESALMNRVVFVGSNLFIPSFLISVGMLVDVSVLVESPRGRLVAAAMVAGVVATKYAAAWLARRLFGYSAAAGNVMFGLSVVQAAATLAAVLVGYELKIFDESVLNGAIAMIAVTCPLGAWCVERYGRRMAAAEPETARPARARPKQRLLIAVSNPASAARLLDLSFVLREPTRDGEIHAITIVRDEDGVDEAVTRGEDLLGECLSHAAGADVPLSAGVRVGLNVADGLVRAAKELRADQVLLGWEGPRTAARRVFGTVTQQLLDECPSRLFLCRLVRPLNTTRRLLVPLPPLAARRTDVRTLISEVKWLGKQIGASARFYLCEPASVARLKAAIEGARPTTTPAAIVECPDWFHAHMSLMADVKADDMAILPVERRTSVLWTPSLDALPQQVAARFPDANLVAAYPGLQTGEEEEVLLGEEAAVWPEVRAVGGLKEADGLAAALDRMAAVATEGSASSRDAVRLGLNDAARRCPVEIIPGVVLLHAHCMEEEGSLLLVAASPKTWALEGIEAPVRFLLALLGPHEMQPQQHLKVLSELARRLNDESVSERIAAAAGADEVAAILRETAPSEGQKPESRSATNPEMET